jgi:hypothetical protein
VVKLGSEPEVHFGRRLAKVSGKVTASPRQKIEFTWSSVSAGSGAVSTDRLDQLLGKADDGRLDRVIRRNGTCEGWLDTHWDFCALVGSKISAESVDVV